jgi:16S rRNA (guanine(527)-N(7))-methyltransferase RsmG
MKMPEQVERFEETLLQEMERYALELSRETLERLSSYYELLLTWNNRLHLVAPCSPEEFASRHILESLILVSHLPHGAKVADVGSGSGLPVLPCLIARPDLTATLIESSRRKAVFLREALNKTDTAHLAAIVARPFEEVTAPAVDFVTCRALDRFVQKVSRLIEWAPVNSSLLLFGGEGLIDQLQHADVRFSKLLIPNSEKRFLLSVVKPF